MQCPELLAKTITKQSVGISNIIIKAKMKKREYAKPHCKVRVIDIESIMGNVESSGNGQSNFGTGDAQDAKSDTPHLAKGNAFSGEEDGMDATNNNIWED